MLHQLVGVEVVVVAEDLLDDQPPLLGEPLAAAGEELGESLGRRQLDRNRPQRKALRHRRLRYPISSNRRETAASSRRAFRNRPERSAQDRGDAVLPNVGHLLNLFDQVCCVGNLHFIADRRRAGAGRRLGRPGGVQRTDGLRAMQMSGTVNLHPVLPSTRSPRGSRLSILPSLRLRCTVNPPPASGGVLRAHVSSALGRGPVQGKRKGSIPSDTRCSPSCNACDAGNLRRDDASPHHPACKQQTLLKACNFRVLRPGVRRQFYEFLPIFAESASTTGGSDYRRAWKLDKIGCARE